jgi:hypothetical protein
MRKASVHPDSVLLLRANEESLSDYVPRASRERLLQVEEMAIVSFLIQCQVVQNI